jgi:hypothetical protein
MDKSKLRVLVVVDANGPSAAEARIGIFFHAWRGEARGAAKGQA